MMRIIVLGEIISKAGIYALRHNLKDLKKKYDATLVIANANSVSYGYGLSMSHAIALRKIGIDSLLLGDKAFYKKDMINFIEQGNLVLRPYNLPHDAPGRSWRLLSFDGATHNKKDKTFDKEVQADVLIMNIIGIHGHTHMHVSNIYTSIEYALEKIEKRAKISIVHMHSRISAEKQSMFHLLDGKVSAIIGSGALGLSADSGISKNGTAYISDTGRCGSIASVGGFGIANEIERFMTGQKIRSVDAWQDIELQGICLTFSDSYMVTHIEPFRYACDSSDVVQYNHIDTMVQS